MFSLLAVSLRIGYVQSVSLLGSIASLLHLFHLLLESINGGLYLITIHLRSNLRCSRNPLFVAVGIRTLHVPSLAQGQKWGWMILSQEHQVLLHPVLVVQQDSALCHVLDVGNRVVSDRGSSVCRLQCLIERTLTATNIVPYLVGSSAIPATERNIMTIHITHVLISIFAHHASLVAVTKNLLGCCIRSIPKFFCLNDMLAFNIPYQLVCSFLKVWAIKESRQTRIVESNTHFVITIFHVRRRVFHFDCVVCSNPSRIIYETKFKAAIITHPINVSLVSLVCSNSLCNVLIVSFQRLLERHLGITLQSMLGHHV